MISSKPWNCTYNYGAYDFRSGLTSQTHIGNIDYEGYMRSTLRPGLGLGPVDSLMYSAAETLPSPVSYGLGLKDSYNTFFVNENPSSLDYIGAIANIPPGGKTINNGVGFAAGVLGAIGSISRKIPSRNNYNTVYRTMSRSHYDI